MTFHKKLSFLLLTLSYLILQPSNSQAWQPDSTLTGNWQCRSEIFADFKKGVYPSKEPEDIIELSITINTDGKVSGTIGNAHFVNCRINKNRTWLGRTLHMRTDYIITGGYLEGKINSLDPGPKRTFTIPFNLADNSLKGSFMMTKPWHYPYPMFPRLNMTRESQ